MLCQVVAVITSSNSVDDLTAPAASLMQDGTLVFAVAAGSKVNHSEIEQVCNDDVSLARDDWDFCKVFFGKSMLPKQTFVYTVENSFTLIFRMQEPQQLNYTANF